MISRLPTALVPRLSLVVAGLTILGALAMHRAPQRWSDAATWSGAFPRVDGDVTIPRGRTVVLDVDPPRLHSLQIDGRLIVADRDVVLRATQIMVRGAFEIGSAHTPFTHHARIVLDGAAASVGIAVFGGGRLELFGRPATAWLHLAATADAGSQAIRLENAPTWQAGDVVAIAPSGFDAAEAEERTVAAIDGSRVTLTAPLRYRHWGTFASGVDERAEVGLLTHTITIEGATPPAAGGISIYRDGALHAANVAFLHLGTRAKLGAYPIHFHLAGNAAGSFVMASSIVHSANRCLTIHGTSGVEVRDNVAFDTIGHCYFLEDGIERANAFVHNLGMLTRAAAPGEAILDSDIKPATFWMTNPDNAVTGNVAAGSEGSGFWYALSPHPTGPSADATIWPRRTPLRCFTENVAHSNAFNGLFVDILKNPRGVSEAPNYSPPTLAIFDRFTTYKDRRRGAWLRGTNLRLAHATIADTSIGATLAGSDERVIDSMIVGESGNVTGPPKPFEPDFPIRGFEFYDGQVAIERTHFVNFRSNTARRASALGTLQYSPFFTDPTNFARALTFTNAEPVYFAPHHGADDSLGADGYRSTAFRDTDGSVTGDAGATVVLDTPLLLNRGCYRMSTWNALVCDKPYASVFIYGMRTTAAHAGPVRVARHDGSDFVTLYGNPAATIDAAYQTNVAPDGAYSITFGAHVPAHVRVGVHHLGAGRRITLHFPQATARTMVAGESAGARRSQRHDGGTVVVTIDAPRSGSDDASAIFDLCEARCK